MPEKSSKKPTLSFREKVYKIVQRIPKGEVLSYKQVAKLAGKPRAFRAAGNVLNQNKDPKIPCHRVVKSDGRVGDYRRGRNKKIALLQREGIIINYHGKIASRPGE